ncbi:Hypothetical_protein [Hexamita inflata]|uniref:Hypothetical_protein n=1 Tax=Hexamita inflata TaxID=28002 RepID=A0AA86UNL1_9EUKA|nr:Hypothetical protein HINF_LOCUS46003 [Hexamita inflata]CAI9958361.1 Hypothetical protein HINF_LOCUS46006 [Hexamita inflata]
MQRKLFQNRALLQIDYELKQFKRNKKNQTSVNNLKTQLSDIQEGSTLACSVHSSSLSSKQLSTGSMSTNVFWDQSEADNVRMLCISGSNGKRSVQEVTISTGQTDVQHSQEELDIYDLLFCYLCY